MSDSTPDTKKDEPSGWAAVLGCLCLLMVPPLILGAIGAVIYFLLWAIGAGLRAGWGN